jgi:hypothetical protein
VVRALNGQKFKFRAARQPIAKAETCGFSAKSRASHKKNREVQGHDLQAVVVVLLLWMSSSVPTGLVKVCRLYLRALL